MQPKKNIGPRVSDKTREWLAENFQSITAGAELLLECNRVLYSRTLAGLRGTFTDNELSAMIDVMNAHAINPFTSGSELPLCLEDAIAIEGLADKWQVDGRALLDKIAGLPAYSIACLEWWANGFWYGGGTNRQERILDAYVQGML